MAVRPKTLPAAAAPILIGTSMAYSDAGFHAGAALACFLTVLLLQIGTNFCNDYCDFLKGADNENRVGPTRVTQAGFVSPRVIGWATVITFALAFLVGLYLINRSGWPMAVIMLTGIACGVFYTAGPLPLGYLGLGDVFVLIFFGPVAVAGTHFAQTDFWSIDAVLIGLASGFLAVGILVMNNLRDMHNDATAGKRTLAVRFGVRFSQFQYALCLLLPLLLVIGVVVIRQAYWGALIVTFLFFPMSGAIRTVFQYRESKELIPMLGRTASLLLLFSILFALGWGLS
jgi:1,4-dihydroxy-2-naphthoate octaprenyltransferase